MEIKYSAKTGGFYYVGVNLDIPADAVDVTPAEKERLLQLELSGKIIRPNKDGYPEAVDPPPMTIEQEKLIYSRAVQERLDSVAVEHGYDDIKTAVSYAEEPAVPKFQHDGKAFRAWRSLVWAYVYEQLDLVLSGKRQKPTVEQLLIELPVLTGL
ncbi:hypothetical protein [Chitinibacter sp. ZOR0017]|uniref:hypothetical protein n=1 Tax=Chitinibacter sp. ZOR0017 TaxID=1339254 RepID=UPI000689D6D9|nr:hypothetical protein [Chitinibacter sp. ZOR0017]